LAPKIICISYQQPCTPVSPPQHTDRMQDTAAQFYVASHTYNNERQSVKNISWYIKPFVRQLPQINAV